MKLQKAGINDSIYVPLTLSLYFTPNTSNPPDQVHLELFDDQTPRLWSDGYPNEIENFGAASVRALDEDELTGERIWEGTVIDNTVAYIRVRNNNDFAIDFLVFTFDNA